MHTLMPVLFPFKKGSFKRSLASHCYIPLVLNFSRVFLVSVRQRLIYCHEGRLYCSLLNIPFPKVVPRI